MEALAQGFPGIEHAYAIQAGRELRVIANAHMLTDSEALKTCREIAKSIEQQTTKLPSDTFLWAAFGSMGIAAALQIMGRKDDAQFVGQWAAPFLILGMYNKMVKLHGSE